MRISLDWRIANFFGWAIRLANKTGSKKKPKEASEAGGNRVLADESQFDTEDGSQGIPAEEEAQFIVKHGSVEHSGKMPRSWRRENCQYSNPYCVHTERS